MISNNGKKTYKIILNTFDTTSYTTVGGNFYNSVFPIDLKAIIRDPQDYEKPYFMTFSFQSIEDTNIFYDGAYGIHIDCNKPINVMQNNNNSSNKLYSGVLVAYTAASRTTPRFLTMPYDNDPVYYTDIKNITAIQIRVVSLQTNAVLVPTGSGKYWIATINFTEA
jgi:hypothetical protein